MHPLYREQVENACDIGTPKSILAPSWHSHRFDTNNITQVPLISLAPLDALVLMSVLLAGDLVVYSQCKHSCG